MERWSAALPPDPYGQIRESIREGVSVEDAITALLELWTSRYEADRPVNHIKVLEHGGAEYLFDGAEGTPTHLPDRTIAAFGFPQTAGQRDTSYQAGFPMPARFTRDTDRGHMFPHTAGGLFGPNIFRQDRALNQGKSEEGRRYRAMETLAVTRSLFFFCVLIFCDDSDVPALVELGLVEDKQLRVEVFRNRFDPVALKRFSLDPEGWLACLTKREWADLGEETARYFIETELRGTIVALGDSELPRDAGRQDQDIVAILDGELTAVEVKTSYLAKRAGTMTPAGNLHPPRLRRAGGGSQQGSQGYVAERLSQFAEVDGEIRSLVAVLDLKALLIQFYGVENGRITQPTASPADCRAAIVTALDELRRFAEAPTVEPKDGRRQTTDS